MIKRILNKTEKVIEIYIPSISLMVLLFSFIAGIISRYIFKNPQSWTYELDSITFFITAMLSTCLVSKTDENVVFDMIYNKFGKKGKCLMRIISNSLISIFAAILLPYSIKFVLSLNGLYTQVIKIPRGLPFICFCTMLAFTIFYSILRLIYDISSYRKGKYDELSIKEDD